MKSIESENSSYEQAWQLALINDKLLKDYYAVAQTCDDQKDEIARLNKKLALYEESADKSKVDQIMELQDLVDALSHRLHWIWAVGVDYDGCEKPESLKELIDEMVAFTQMSDKEVNTQLKTIKQMQRSINDVQAENQRLAEQVHRLQKYDKERDIQLHARLSSEAYDKGSIEAATKILHYLYPFWQDTTSKEVAVGRAIEWIKATFGV